jgi:zinc/manganese transport system permease protein
MILGSGVAIPDPISAVTGMLAQPFIVHALVAGTAVAILSGLVGYFVVLRGQVFAGDALGHVAYTGAFAALALGLDLRIGMFAATIGAGLVLGLLGGRSIADDVTIGTVFSWVLGLGVFFLAWYTTHASNSDSTANVNVLFGSIFGISTSAMWAAVAVAVVVVFAILTIARPLLFASVDSAVADAAGVPVRTLGALFLAMVGATAAEASQIVGALLLFGLLAAPAAAARRLTPDPWRALWLAAILATASVWAGIVISYAVPVLPVSFTIMTVAATLYAMSFLRRTAPTSASPATSPARAEAT